MCGIVGFFGIDREKVDLPRMLAFVAHRGPDGKDSRMGDRFGLGHHRLAIIDLAGGRQPMHNEDKTVWMVGNNEIYNFLELRKELENKGHHFLTRSDTEVVVHAYEEWGEDCFDRFDGMFALAIVDERNGRCLVARDHAGIKPLLYAEYRGGYVFASEAKAILSLDGFNRALDREAFHLFMNFRYVPTNDTLFSGIKRLPSGSYAALDDAGNMRINCFYSLLDKAESSRWKNQKEAADALEHALAKTVKRHLVSDVPVGIYLSGGIDSSLVTSFAAAGLPHIRTFCMTFGEPTDEDKDAQRVADSVGSQHSAIPVGEMPLTNMPEVIWHVEEPKVNSIQGYFLARAVRDHVKVVLSGMGGDELFAGYTNNDILYPMTQLTRFLRLPPITPAYQIISALRGAVNDPAWDRLFRIMDLGASILNPVMFYSILRNTFDHSASLTWDMYGKDDKGLRYTSLRALAPIFNAGQGGSHNRILALEMCTKMINDFLLNEDRTSMAHGVEVRPPLLARDIIDLAFSIPTKWKYSPGNKKKLLKEVARNRLPREILAKKKWGFSFDPYYQFTKDLRIIAQKELSEKRVGELGLFNYRWIRKVIDHEPLPRMRWHYFNLWVMLGFSIWHRIFIENLASERPPPLCLKSYN